MHFGYRLADVGLLAMEGITKCITQDMTLGFDWDNKEMSVMFMAKLAKPLIGTARVVINIISSERRVLSGGILAFCSSGGLKLRSRTIIVPHAQRVLAPGRPWACQSFLECMVKPRLCPSFLLCFFSSTLACSSRSS